MGRPVTILLDHDLGIEGAKLRVDERFEALMESIAGKMPVTVERAWQEDSLSFKAKGLGQRITGDIDVFPAHVRIVLILPALLAGMAEAIKGRVEKDGQLMLEQK